MSFSPRTISSLFLISTFSALTVRADTSALPHSTSLPCSFSKITSGAFMVQWVNSLVTCMCSSAISLALVAETAFMKRPERMELLTRWAITSPDASILSPSTVPFTSSIPSISTENEPRMSPLTLTSAVQRSSPLFPLTLPVVKSISLSSRRFWMDIPVIFSALGDDPPKSVTMMPAFLALTSM